MSTVLNARKVRLGVDGELWTSQRDPIRVLAFARFAANCARAASQAANSSPCTREIIAELDALVEAVNRDDSGAD